LVEGRVTKLSTFGAFALVDDEIEGLIHISELSNQRINHPKEAVREGEKYIMRIIRIDPTRRRMGLSLKRVTDPQYADLDWQAELGAAESADEPSGSDLPEPLEHEIAPVAAVDELEPDADLPEGEADLPEGEADLPEGEADFPEEEDLLTGQGEEEGV